MKKEPSTPYRKPVRPRAVQTHEVRIIGGQFKRTKLPVADKPGLRPTPDRVRETLFNWLGQDLTGWRCLDAFAGTGVLGFEAVSYTHLDQAVYGKHPYGYEMTEATLSRIDVADMAALYRTMIQPCRAKVTLVGAVNRAQADTLVQQLFARLTDSSQAGACVALPAVPEVQALTQAAEQHISFDSAQAHVLIGQPGYKRDDPDYFALTVGNYILGGGGFVSRLTHEVREKRGLSYSVYSYFAPGLHAGAFTVGLQTRPDQADEAVKVARSVLAEFVAEGHNEAELKAAKDNLAVSYTHLDVYKRQGPSAGAHAVQGHANGQSGRVFAPRGGLGRP